MLGNHTQRAQFSVLYAGVCQDQDPKSQDSAVSWEVAKCSVWTQTTSWCCSLPGADH